jgi:hypothetical protein
MNYPPTTARDGGHVISSDTTLNPVGVDDRNQMRSSGRVTQVDLSCLSIIPSHPRYRPPNPYVAYLCPGSQHPSLIPAPHILSSAHPIPLTRTMPPEPSAKSAPSRKRSLVSKRGAIACVRCKERKAKCVPAPPGTSSLPTCTNCFAARAECVYLERTPNELFLLE